MRIALAGNPNAGKSTLFNALCAGHAHVANYAGATVERREAPLLPWSHEGPAACASAGASVVPTLIDLPGCYSLTARSADEDVAQRALIGEVGQPGCDFVACVVDALQLARGLYLVLQLRELGVPGLVVLNMSDVARSRGLDIDVQRLAARLHLPVLCCAARTGEGVAEVGRALMQASRRHAMERQRAPHPEATAPPTQRATASAPALPACPFALSAPERATLAALTAKLAEAGHPEAPCLQGLALWLVTSRLETLRLQLAPPLRHALVSAQASLNGTGAGAFNRRIINARFAAVDQLVAEVQRTGAQPAARSVRLDHWLLHPFFGALILVAAMFVLFQAVFAWAAPVMAATGAVVDALAQMLRQLLPAGAFASLLVDGLLVGAGNVLTFVPQIGLLFFGLGLLEESGYMARAACLLDRAMRRVGLSGRAFIPLLSSFACAVPGILATRTLSSRADRLRTMLVAPLMSCSARLPVYALVIAASFAHVPPLAGVVNVGGLIILAMYLLGFAAAMFTAWLLRRTVVAGPVPRLLLELPDYRLPRITSVARQAARQCTSFITGSGGTIVALSALLWAAMHYPNVPRPPPGRVGQATLQAPAPPQAGAADDDAAARAWRLEHSAAGRLGHLVEPALRPLGFDWRIGVGLIASFAAREVLVSTLAQIYAFDTAEPAAQPAAAAAPAFAVSGTPPTRAVTLSDTLRLQRDAQGLPTFTPLVGMSLMVFFVLALQCSSTVAVLRRETGTWRWPVAALIYLNALAWLASFAVFQGGRALGLR